MALTLPADTIETPNEVHMDTGNMDHSSMDGSSAPTDVIEAPNDLPNINSRADTM